MARHKPQLPVGGRLRSFLNRWRKITSDPSIIDIVSGMTIELLDLPVQHHKPRPIPLSQEEITAGNAHIETLLQKRAIVPASPFGEDHFISNVFMVPKRDGGHRMILNLKKFNKFVEYHHFKMDTLNHILSYITSNCFMANFDFCDAYLTVGISRKHVKFLKFTWQGKTYMYIVLPFGISSAPRKFTKLLKPILALLQKQGIIVLFYIDDGFTAAQTYEECYQNVCNIMRTFSYFGFLLHRTKSAPEPSQQVRSLGFHLNSITMNVTLPSDKIENAMSLCALALHKKHLQIVFLAQVIGTLVSLFPACPLGKLHYRSLERVKISALRHNRGNFEAFCLLDNASLCDLQWWLDTIPTTAAPIARNNPTDIIFTDSSDYAWCGFYNDMTANSFYTAEECDNIIAFKELLAIYYAIRSFSRYLVGNHVLIRSDSTNAIAYLRDMGGMKNLKMDLLARDIWTYAIQHNFWITASFIPGRENTDADTGSRFLSTWTEWTLPATVFTQITQKLFVPSIDLFASRLNAQLERYVSWNPDPYATDVDAFVISWTDEIPFIFPPFCLLFRCLQKLIKDRVKKAILVFPLWPSQHWFPRLLQMVSSPIFLLPERPAIYLPWETTVTQHPLQDSLLLSAVEVTPHLLNSRTYHPKFQASFSMESGNPLRNCTRQSIGTGISLQVQGVSTRICPL